MTGAGVMASVAVVLASGVQCFRVIVEYLKQ
jgi:hypothetical protein